MAQPLHVETTGEGTPVILLHSSGLSGRQWRSLVPELVKRGMRAVVPDLTGHGASPPLVEPESFSFRTDVERVVAIVKETQAAHVVGHSYGALVGLHAAALLPGALRGVTLYEPVAFGVLDGPEDADARETLARVKMHWGGAPEEHEAWLAQFVDYWGGAGAWTALREPARAEFRRVGWAVREGVRSLMEDQTRASTFARVTAPMRLFTAERSPIAAQRVVRRLGEAVEGAKVTTIAGVGHLGPVTNAEVVTPLLVEAVVGR
jgi:pimeloyl-ACP methyl ester carboxylesterase